MSETTPNPQLPSQGWRTLRRNRPRSRLLQASTWLLLAGTVAVWASGTFAPGDLFSARRRANLWRFLSEDALPRPLRDGEGLGGLGSWLQTNWESQGAAATWATLQLALVASVLAALVGLALAPLVARTLARSDPYGAPGPTGLRWSIAGGLARSACILGRGLPELVLAWILIALVPSSTWAAVLALGIHNGGILGRLFGETLENVDRSAPQAMATAGLRRSHLILGSSLPIALPRLFAYFFYRLETCVRDATVMGLLGVASLGHVIVEARARAAYDEMLLFVACGAGIVLLADRASHFFRERLRQSGSTHVG